MDLLSVDHRLGGVHSVEFFLDCAVMSRALGRSLAAVVQVGVGAGLAGKVDQDALHAARLSVFPEDPAHIAGPILAFVRAHLDQLVRHQIPVFVDRRCCLGR